MATVDEKPKAVLSHWREYIDIVSSREGIIARWRSIALLLAFSNIFLLIIIMIMVPLQRYIPYLIEVDNVTGRALPSLIPVREYTPNEAQIRYALYQIALATFARDRQTAFRLEQVLSYFPSGSKALDRWIEIVTRERVYAYAIGDYRVGNRVTLLSLQYPLRQQNEALVRLDVVPDETTDDRPKRVAIYIEFKLSPPADEKVLLLNPIGLFVSSITVEEEKP